MRIAKSIFQWAAWSLIIALSVYFFLDNVAAFFFGYRSRVFGNTLFNNQLWVVLHLVGGTLALFLGPFQFWKGFRNRYLGVHRVMGKLYLGGVALIGLSGLRLSLVSTCAPCRVSLFLLTLLVMLSAWLAWLSVRRGNLKAHRQFTIRSYVLVMSFVAVRIDQVFPMSFLFGVLEDPVFNRTVNEYFFSFVPLILTEIMMVWLPAIPRKKWRSQDAK